MASPDTPMTEANSSSFIEANSSSCMVNASGSFIGMAQPSAEESVPGITHLGWLGLYPGSTQQRNSSWVLPTWKILAGFSLPSWKICSGYWGWV